MRSISFFTPVSFAFSPTYEQKLLESVDSYFYLGGKRAKVQHITSEEGIKVTHIKVEDKNISTISKIIKIFSYFLILPALAALTTKYLLRSRYKFVITNPINTKKVQKTASKVQKSWIERSLKSRSNKKRESLVKKNKLGLQRSIRDNSISAIESNSSKLYPPSKHLLQVQKKWENLLRFVMKNESSSLFTIKWSTKKSGQEASPNEKQPLSDYPALSEQLTAQNRSLYYREENNFFNEKPYFFLNKDICNSEQMKVFFSLEKESCTANFLPRAYSNEFDAIFDPFFTAMDSSHYNSLEDASISQLLLIFYGAHFYENTLLIKRVLNALCKRNISSEKEEAFLTYFIKSPQELYTKNIDSFLSARIKMNNLLKESAFNFLKETNDFTFIFEEDESFALNFSTNSKNLTLESLQEIIRKLQLKIIINNIAFVSSDEIAQLIEIGAKDASDLACERLASLIKNKNIEKIGQLPQFLQKNINLLEYCYNKKFNYFYDFSSSILMDNEEYAVLEYERDLNSPRNWHYLGEKVLQHRSILQKILKHEQKIAIIEKNHFSLRKNELFLLEAFQYVKNDTEKKAHYFLSFVDPILKVNSNFFHNLIQQDSGSIKYTLADIQVELLIKNIDLYTKSSEIIESSEILNLDPTHLDRIRLLPLLTELQKEKKKIAIYGIFLDPFNINLKLLFSLNIRCISDLRPSALQNNKKLQSLVIHNELLGASQEIEDFLTYICTSLIDKNDSSLERDPIIHDLQKKIDEIIIQERKELTKKVEEGRKAKDFQKALIGSLLNEINDSYHKDFQKGFKRLLLNDNEDPYIEKSQENQDPIIEIEEYLISDFDVKNLYSFYSDDTIKGLFS